MSPVRCRAWIIAVVLGGALVSCRAARDERRDSIIARPATPYASERRVFRTKLVRRGGSLQPAARVALAGDAHEIEFDSGGLRLHAWVSRDAVARTPRRRAVLYLHGTFAFTAEHWRQAKAFRDAGWVTMVPILRGENGHSGEFSMYYDEVDDVLAARAALAALPGVDPSDIVVAGHSAGGVLALLASQTAPLFRKVAAFSAWPDLQPVLEMYPEYCVFDCGDPDEIRLRSPRRFERAWTAPLRLYSGRSER